MDWLDNEGWQSRPLADFAMPHGPLHARVSLEGGLETLPYGIESLMLKRWIDAESWCKEMAFVLEKHDRPARRRKPSEQEFFAIFGLWLIQQLEHEKTYHPSASSKLDSARTKLEYSMSGDRRHTLLAAVGLPMPRIMKLIDNYRASLPQFMTMGRILTLDETILHSTGTKTDAKHKIPLFLRKCTSLNSNSPSSASSPHMADCLIQRFLLSKAPIIANLHICHGRGDKSPTSTNRSNDSNRSNSIGENVMNMILQMEREFGASYPGAPSMTPFVSSGKEDAYMSQSPHASKAQFLILLDANVAASDFLLDPRHVFASSFIGCVTKSSDSGPLKYLAEAQSAGLRNAQKALLHSPKLNLTAYLQGSVHPPMAIVTNAFLPELVQDRDDRQDYNELLRYNRHPLQVSEEAARSLGTWGPVDLTIFIESINNSPLVSDQSQPPPTLNNPEASSLLRTDKAPVDALLPLRDKRKTIFRLTGHDIASPVDAHGYVTAETLSHLSLSELQETARMIKAPSHFDGRPLEREELIHEVLDRHPRAFHKPLFPEDDRIFIANNVTSMDPMAIVQEDSNESVGPFNVVASVSEPSGSIHVHPYPDAADPEKKLRQMMDRLLEPGPEPDFYELYESNFGIDDRINELHYEHWQHTYSKSETSKYSWLLFYMAVLNVFGICQEIHAEVQVNLNGSVNHEKLPSVMDFCITLVEQLAQVYGSDTPSSGLTEN